MSSDIISIINVWKLHGHYIKKGNYLSHALPWLFAQLLSFCFKNFLFWYKDLYFRTVLLWRDIMRVCGDANLLQIFFCTVNSRLAVNTDIVSSNLLFQNLGWKVWERSSSYSLGELDLKVFWVQCLHQRPRARRLKITGQRTVFNNKQNSNI